MGAALAHDYSNIFVTSPDPENLKTLFEFVFKALDALGYEEHSDYDVVQSTNPEFKKAIVRVNVFRGHRQTIQVSVTDIGARLRHTMLTRSVHCPRGRPRSWPG